MKKLFTLFALVVCFLSAKADVVTDYHVDFAEAGLSTIGWKGEGVDAASVFTADEDGVHVTNQKLWDQFYEFQFQLIGGGINLETEEAYTVKIVAKADGNGANLRGRVGSWSADGIVFAFGLTTEYQEYTIDGIAGDGSNFLLAQFGDYVGTVSFKSVTITHEENEQKPVEWRNILINGDAEGEYGEVPCAYSKEYGVNDNNPFASEIMSEGDNKIFVIHSKAVNPPLLWDEDGEQWGTPHSAGDPKPDNAWQNQFWLTFPRQLKDGEQLKISFKYKASKAVKADTQNHKFPGDYLGNSSINSPISFTTSWQTYEQKFSSTAETQSIAFNLGSEIFDEDIDFFFDDIALEEMVLEEGFFAAAVNNNDAQQSYKYENAIKFEYDEEQEAYVATVGTVGKKETWVNEVMISTVRGNDKAFLASTVKPAKPLVNNPDAWIDYSIASKSKIKLPALGVWTISIDDKQINAVKLEGEEDKEPIEVVANPTEVIVKGQERDWLSPNENGAREKDADGNDVSGTGEGWDNQFFIVANRALSAGEEVYISFDYVANKEAKTTTQLHGDPGAYMHWNAIGDVNFTTEEQQFEATFKVPSEADGMKSIAFNMAEIKAACDYTIKNIIWKLTDDTESLIEMEGANNFFVKEGAGDTPHIFGTESGIEEIATAAKVSNVIYNIAGQRVSNNYKGIVIKNGGKYLVK